MRFLSILAALFPVVTCASTLEIWAGINYETADYVKEHIESMTDHRVEIRPFDINSIRSELLVADPRDNTFPDVIWVPSDFLGLTEYIELSTLPSAWVDTSRYEKKALDAVVINDELKALPVGIGNQLVLYSNKPQDHAITWEELIQRSSDSNRATILFPNPNMYFYLAFFQLFSQDMLSSINIDGEGLVSIFEFIDKLEKAKTIEASCNETCARQRFITGEVEFLIDGDWAFSELDQAYGEHLHVNSLPTYRDKAMSSFSGAKIFAITKKGMNNPEKREALKEVVQYLQSNSFTYLAHSNAMISPFREVNQRRVEEGNKTFSNMYDEFQSSQMMSSDYKMAIVWEASARAYERYKSGMPKPELNKFYDDFVSYYSANMGAGD
ncbi:extracellular solute-binding protein [Vibrio splendidus]|uniref:sugar ABC transporter substrate-binding protein n=1 Tax=Vibrio splendidus TaxID=29497 RepID=UPI000C82F820|nr:extracellular solute-binding protein [Vibrio splendidus]PMI75791.1 maltose/maltodextrin-binding protein [Vibrio splendidus]PMK07034.1 maltose/maltodextrin-binding protein [Vibrio splendidus]